MTEDQPRSNEGRPKLSVVIVIVGVLVFSAMTAMLSFPTVKASSGIISEISAVGSSFDKVSIYADPGVQNPKGSYDGYFQGKIPSSGSGSETSLFVEATKTFTPTSNDYLRIYLNYWADFHLHAPSGCTGVAGTACAEYLGLVCAYFAGDPNGCYATNGYFHTFEDVQLWAASSSDYSESQLHTITLDRPYQLFAGTSVTFFFEFELYASNGGYVNGVTSDSAYMDFQSTDACLILSYASANTGTICSGNGDFSLNSLPSTLNVGRSQTTSAGSVIGLTASNGFTGPITLTPAANSAYITPSMNGNILWPFQGLSSPTLNVYAASNAPFGTYSVTVTGDYRGQIGHTTVVTVNVDPPSFNIIPNPWGATILPGGSATISISVNPLYGFSGTVTLTATPTSPVQVSPTSTSVFVPSGGTGSYTLSISTPSSIAYGTYPVTVVGTTGSISNQVEFDINVVNCVSGCGGGGGSVAYGTLITMADGTQVPVQSLRAGDQIIVYNVPTGYQTIATITDLKTVETNTTLTIHTSTGQPLRADASPKMTLWVLTREGPVQKQIALIQPGDQIYDYDTHAWVTVTQVTVATGGQHVLYDPHYTPTQSSGMLLEFIANGYPDFFTD